jgi:hypothetical protein
MRTICLGLLLVGLAACGAPAATGVPTPPPTVARAPTPAINPTVAVRLTATRQRQAEVGEAACQRLDMEFARFGATFQRGQDPQVTLLEYARVSGLNPDAHTTLSDTYVRQILDLARSCQDA